MDPQVTWNNIKDSLRTLDDCRIDQDTDNEGYTRAEAITALRDLADWIEKGGFGPRSI